MTAIPAQTRRAARVDIARLCESGLSGDRLLARLAARLREVVPFDGCFMSSTDPDTLMCTSHAVVDGMPPWMCGPFFHNEFLGDDVNKFTELARRPGHVGTLAEATGGRLGRSARYVDINTTLGFSHEARVAFTVEGRTWAVGNLLREAGRPDFSPDERTFLSAVAEDVARGMRAAVLGREDVRVHALITPGVLTFDAAGSLTGADDAALAQLGMVDPRIPRGAATAFGPLPLAVTMLVSRARAHAAGRGAPPAEARLRTRTGVMLRLQAATARDADLTPGGTVVTISGLSAAELAPSLVDAYELSPRERDVVAFVTRGYAPGDIAARLNLAPDAVRADVRTVLHKTGVTTRGQLSSRIFTDHYYEAHNAGCRPLVS